nr:hypothetical protein CFP56_70221 [Quercus suber]
MRATTFSLFAMASSVLGLRVTFRRFSEPGCPAAFHLNSSHQHDEYIQSNKPCHRFTEQAPFESFIAEVVRGEDQLAHDYCRVTTYETSNCVGPAFSNGDLGCSTSVCGTPKAQGGYHGLSARVLCEKRNMTTTPSVTMSVPSCHATHPASKSSSSTSCKSTKVKTVTAALKSSKSLLSSVSPVSLKSKVSPAPLTHVQPITIHGSSFLTSVLRVSPTTITAAGVCDMAPAVTASVKSVASASAAAMMLARRSVSSAAHSSLMPIISDDEVDDGDMDDVDDDDSEDADDDVEEEAKILIFAEIMKKLQDDLGCSTSVCGTPKAQGGYHGLSARVLCEKRNMTTTPSVTMSVPSCHATHPASKSSSSTSCKSTKVKTVTAALKSSKSLLSSVSPVSLKSKVSPAPLTHVQPITIHGSSFLTSVLRVSPTTITAAGVCDMAPAVTASVKSVASASAAAMMLARRSVSSAAHSSLMPIISDDEVDDGDMDDVDDDDSEDADDDVEEEAKILIFAEIMKKLQDGCEADQE